MIVNDGSTDRTAEICEEYARKYNHIKYICFSDNRGTNAGRNAAIRVATGEWIIILDSDDYFTNNAVTTINTTIKEKPIYKHYMFAPDDMVSRYEANFLLSGRNERELSFADFLSGCVSGDFIHVMQTDILREYPFNESVRIHEGVFFLRFYKAAKRMLFSNKVVAVRERNREDSVTRDSIRTSKVFIERIVRSKELNLEWFGNDYKALGLTDKLGELYYSLSDNYLLLGRYKDAERYIEKMHEAGINVGFSHMCVYMLRLGWLYRNVLRIYLKVKYNVLMASLQR